MAKMFAIPINKNISLQELKNNMLSLTSIHSEVHIFIKVTHYHMFCDKLLPFYVYSSPLITLSCMLIKSLFLTVIYRGLCWACPDCSWLVSFISFVSNWCFFNLLKYVLIHKYMNQSTSFNRVAIVDCSIELLQLHSSIP